MVVLYPTWMDKALPYIPPLTLEKQLMLLLGVILYVGLMLLVRAINKAMEELDDDD